MKTPIVDGAEPETADPRVLISQTSSITLSRIDETATISLAIEDAGSKKRTATAVRITTHPPTKTPTSTITMTPSPGPSPTSTPQPPLEAHSWVVDPIILGMETGGGDGYYSPPYPPDMVLYGNGLFIIPKLSDTLTIDMHGRILSRQEICTLLNTFDQIGFLDYDHSIFNEPGDGAEVTNIVVNAWKKQQVGGQLLGLWVHEGGDWWYEICPAEVKDCQPPPIILPALANAVKFLETYNPGNLIQLPIEQVIIWINGEEFLDPGCFPTPEPWPIEEITLHEIYEAALAQNDISMVTSDQTVIQALEKSVTNGYYQEGDLELKIYLRPLWPEETHFGIWVPGLPDATPTIESGITLSCYPEDGTLPIPE